LGGQGKGEREGKGGKGKMRGRKVGRERERREKKGKVGGKGKRKEEFCAVMIFPQKKSCLVGSIARDSIGQSLILVGVEFNAPLDTV